MSEFSAPNPDYQETVKRLLLEMPYVAWLGITFERIAPGQVELQMPHRPEITFDGNAVQAGPIGALLDFAGGSAAFTLVASGVMLSTIDYSVKLLAPAIGQRFIARGAVISAGKSLIVSRADAFAVNPRGERLIATGLVTMRVVS